MNIINKLIRNVWNRTRDKARRLFRSASGSGAGTSRTQGRTGSPGLVRRAFALLSGDSSGASDGTRLATDEATARLYDAVISRLSERQGPRSLALVPVLLARAEYEAARGCGTRARNAAAAAHSIMLARWGRRHPLWPLVEARCKAICGQPGGQSGRR
ncbi:MAG: hypothetical protein D6763_06740 [Alphaproteobacteria bacterium]|nr:MAG: hypothetical protein D6763_06740 [Alphaproteobacteria bacterium]